MPIRELDPADLDRLEPLWFELHAHHQAVAPELAPFVDDTASWTVRRRLYEETLAGNGFALILEEGGRDLGYALVGEVAQHWPASLVTEPRGFEVHTLLVRDDARGRGAGTALLDAIEERLAAEPADRFIGVIPSNTRAAALYERRGLVPTLLLLTRFGRPGQARQAVADPAVEPVAADELDAVGPLWLALHHHHQRVAPELAPYLDDAPSWERMRGQLVPFAEQGRLLRVGPAAAPLGIAAFSTTSDVTLWADTWVTGPVTGELDVVVVSDEARGQGIGTRLMDTVDALLAAEGVHDQVVAAFAGNRAAIDLYRRRGFHPAWLTLVGFHRPRAG